LQYPYIKKSYVESLLDYINYVKPDKLLCVGDELDCQTISTFSRGTALEFEGSLQKNINGLKGLLKEFRSAIGNKPFHYTKK
jgi:vacuolar-type H+-ATPase subunit C/Vma6